MTGVEREPLTITLPHGATETTMWLVSAYCEPHATRATEQEARQLCETAERANLETGAEFAWHPTDDTELTHELYVVLGDEFRTEYTVTPIGRTQEQLTPLTARTLGHILTARRRDIELGQALVAAADLIEGVTPNTDGEA